MNSVVVSLGFLLCAANAWAQGPKLYFSLAPLGGLQPNLQQHAQERIVQTLSAYGKVLDDKKQPRSFLRQKAKVYRLLVEFTPTGNGGLQLNVVCFTQPERKLLGEVTLKASGGNAEQLVDVLVPKAMEEAAQTFDWTKA